MKKNKIALLLMAVIIGIYIVFFPPVDVETTTKVLKQNGYKPINVGGYAFSYVGENTDLYKTKFKAIAPNGDTVTGVVSRGFFKGNTIRLNN